MGVLRIGGLGKFNISVLFLPTFPFVPFLPKVLLDSYADAILCRKRTYWVCCLSRVLVSGSIGWRPAYQLIII